MKEKWHTLEFEDGAYSNFSISNFGRIKNTRTKVILKTTLTPNGYKQVNLYNKFTKRQNRFRIHRLVGLYFVRGDKSLIINHKDGNKTNNHYTNLEWVTYSENLSHAYKNNLRNQDGIKNPSNVYSEKTIRKICSLLENGKTTKEIIEIVFDDYFPKYKDLIRHLKNRERWNSINKDYNY